jgi:O-antigen ligase
MLANSASTRVSEPAAISWNDTKATPIAHRLVLLIMLVFVAKIADVIEGLGGFQIGKVFIALAILALIVEKGGWREGLWQHPIVRPFLVITVLVLASVPFSIWPGQSVNYLLQVFAKDLIFALLLLVTIQSFRDLKRTMWMFVVAALILDYVLLRHGLAGVSAFQLGRNEIAMVTVLAVAMLLPLPAAGVMKVVKWGALVFMVAAILNSESRGSYLGIAVVGVAHIYLRVGGKLAATAVVVLVLGYVAYTQLPASVTGRVETIVNYEQDYNFTAQEGRVEIWKRGLRMIKANPLTGVGIGNFTTADGLMRTVPGRWMNAHNSPLQVAAEIGLLGLIFYLVLLVRMFRASSALRKAPPDKDMALMGDALVLTFIGYAVTGFFLHAGFATIFYILIVLTIAADRIAARMKARGEHELSH